MASGPSTGPNSSDEDFDESPTEVVSEILYACTEILKQKGVIIGKVMTRISDHAWLLGDELANTLLQMVKDHEFSEVEELFAKDEFVESVSDDGQNMESQECSQETSPTESSQSISQPMSSDYEPEEKIPKFESVDLEKKIKVVNLAREHPKWTFKTLKVKGAACLSRIDELARWKKEIQKGGTKFDKSNSIKKWTYDRFCEARSKQLPVTTRNIQEWALQAAMQYRCEEFHFSASATWTSRFKQEFRIRQRKVTKYVKSTEKRSLEELLKSAENFQTSCLNSICLFDPNYVLNTDQMGCEYRVNVQRTMEYVGQKSVDVHLGDMNKVTHTYTAQYTITASGKLLPKVFICLQEPKGTFGPRVGERVEALTSEYKNVYVTCSKSGKLTSALFDSYTVNILQPYVEGNNFSLILDSWGGQSNKNLFRKFENQAGESTCNLQVIPAGCTAYCQPLDVYFHRQAKILIRELQNSTYLLQEQRQINSREDAIKIQSLVTNQLCAPVFREMIEYAWFASKLIQSRDVFMNVRDVCFPEKPFKSRCKCALATDDCSGKFSTFIKCSWCREYLCFHCFYELYHPHRCTQYFINT